MSKPTVLAHDCATYAIGTHTAAWAFVRAAESAGLLAGYPSLDGRYTVKVSIRTWMDRETADKLAGAIPVDYHFAGQVLPA